MRSTGRQAVRTCAATRAHSRVVVLLNLSGSFRAPQALEQERIAAAAAAKISEWDTTGASHACSGEESTREKPCNEMAISHHALPLLFFLFHFSLVDAQRERDAAAAAVAQSAAAALAAEQEERRLARESAKRVRATFGKLCKASGLADADVDALRASLTIEQMQPIIEGFTAEEQSAQAKELFSTHLAALRAVEQAAARARDEAAAAAAAAKKQREAAAVWTEEEEAMLAKAIKLHAPGSGLRWHKVRNVAALQSAARRGGRARWNRALWPCPWM